MWLTLLHNQVLKAHAAHAGLHQTRAYTSSAIFTQGRLGLTDIVKTM